MISLQKYRKNKCTWCWQFIEEPNQPFCSQHCQAAFDKSSSCHFCGNPIEQSKKTNPSCRECDAIVNDYPTYCCSAGRAAAMTDLYTDKYRTALRLIDWDQEELEEMGKNMRSCIRKALGEKYCLEARLAHLSFRARIHT